MQPLALVLITVISIVAGLAVAAQAQTGDQVTVTATKIAPGFTFQGELHDNGIPVNANCDIRAALWDAPSGGVQVGSTQTAGNTAVRAGRFTIVLNTSAEFGADAFTGQARWLEIAVRCPAGSGDYAVLQPRQALTAAPYAHTLVPGALISGTVGAPSNSVLSLGNLGENGVGLRVLDAGLDGVYIDRAVRHGVTVIGSLTGVNVESTRGNGIYVGSAGGNGMYVSKADYIGLYVGNAKRYGLDVAGSSLAGYFYGAVQITGGCTGCALTAFGINSGQAALQPGDIVALRGSHLSQADGVPLLLEVAPADGSTAVVGIVMGRAEEVAEESPRPHETGRRLVPRQGAAQPGELVTIVTFGLAQVRMDPAATPLAIGSRLAAGGAAGARPLQTVEVNGVTLNEAAPTIGMAVESGDSDGDGLIWVFVNPG
ncbi:MAG: hypothetical protein H3C34_05725 [Caldilineaceae bacterium]|nr:hypothetical protein [Caldilineaceae bacterium]